MKHGSFSFLKHHAALIYKEFKEATSYCIDVKKLRCGMSFTDRKWYNNQDGRNSIKPGCRNQKVLPTGYDITSGGPVRSTHTHTHTPAGGELIAGADTSLTVREGCCSSEPGGHRWQRALWLSWSSAHRLQSLSVWSESQKRYISLKSNFKY